MDNTTAYLRVGPDGQVTGEAQGLPEGVRPYLAAALGMMGAAQSEFMALYGQLLHSDVTAVSAIVNGGLYNLVADPDVPDAVKAKLTYLYLMSGSLCNTLEAREHMGASALAGLNDLITALAENKFAQQTGQGPPVNTCAGPKGRAYGAGDGSGKVDPRPFFPHTGPAPRDQS